MSQMTSAADIKVLYNEDMNFLINYTPWTLNTFIKQNRYGMCEAVVNCHIWGIFDSIGLYGLYKCN